MAAYGLATGILAAGAGALVASAHRYLGSLAGATSLATIVAIAALASLATDAVLGWLLPLHRTGSSRHS